MAIKYQQTIHKAFAKTLSDGAQKSYEDAISQYPLLAKKVSVSDFMNEDAAAISEDNVAICEYFAVCGEEADAFEFDTPHLNSVKKTVKTNAAYYRNLLQFINDETDEEYVKLYKAILAKFDTYFAQAAEDILADVYGEQYTAFFDAKSKELAEQKKKNSPKKDEGEE